MASGPASADVLNRPARPTTEVDTQNRTPRRGWSGAAKGSGIEGDCRNGHPNHPRRAQRVQVRNQRGGNAKGSTPTPFCWPSTSRPTTGYSVWLSAVMRMTVQRAQRAWCSRPEDSVSGAPSNAGRDRPDRKWTREGRVPLHTLRADIDYAPRWPTTTYGVLGIKSGCFKGRCFPAEGATARR